MSRKKYAIKSPAPGVMEAYVETMTGLGYTYVRDGNAYVFSKELGPRTHTAVRLPFSIRLRRALIT